VGGEGGEKRGGGGGVERKVRKVEEVKRRGVFM
jgi:hypothetical protein